MFASKSKVPRFALALLAALALGCASTAPESTNDRLVRGRDYSAVLSTALKALGDLGVRPIAIRPRAGGGVLVASVRPEGPQGEVFEVEVTVLEVREGVRVAVCAEVAETRPSPSLVAAAAGSGAGSGSACGCPDKEPLEASGRSRDNLKALSESRKLVRAYLALFDERLR